jgi:hypothetical protein
MTFPFNDISSAFARQPVLPAPVSAVRRAHGALRYRCPSTGSFVLLTDPAVLTRLTDPDAPVHCPGCGRTHLLAQDCEMPDIVRSRTAA